MVRLVSDAPIIDPSMDELGFSEFAAQVARIVCAPTNRSSRVVAICGPWGAGKSTAIELVRNELRRNTADCPVDQLRFNPWWYTSSQNLARELLEELLRSLFRHYRLGRRAKAVAASFLELAGGAPGGVGGASKSIAARLRSEASLAELKDKVVGALAEKKGVVLVIVDDLDRLDGREAHAVLSAMKSVADFPNIVYLLAFDDRVLCDLLKNEANVHEPRRFLEKIVQVFLPLPVPTPDQLLGFLGPRLDSVFEETAPRFFSEDRWSSLYLGCIRPLMRTPRAAIQLCNAYAALGPMISTELDSVDFLGLQVARFWIPELYSRIAEYPNRFASDPDQRRWAPDEAEQAVEFHKAWYDSLPPISRAPAEDLVELVFPRAGAALRGHQFGGEAHFERVNGRLAARSNLEMALRLAREAGAPTLEEATGLLSPDGVPEGVAQRLLESVEVRDKHGRTRLRAILDRVTDLLKSQQKLVPKGVLAFVGGLLSAGNSLLVAADEEQGLLGVGNDHRVERCLQAALDLLPQDASVETIESSLQRDSSCYFGVLVVFSMAAQHGEIEGYGEREEDRRWGSSESLARLKRAAVERLARAAREDALLREHRPGFLIFQWRRWAGESAQGPWITAQTSTVRGTLELARAFEGKQRSVSNTGYSEEVHLNLDALLEIVTMEPLERVLRDAQPAEMIESGLADTLDRLQRAVERREVERRGANN